MARLVKPKQDHDQVQLSKLPDNALLKILSMTKSYRFAVECSVVSRHWRTFYTRLPYLHFTHADILNDKDSKYPKIEYEEVVSRALFRHRSGIKAVHMEASDLHSLRSWLRFLCFNRVEELEVIVNRWDTFGSNAYVVLPELFSCSSLTKLSFKCMTTYFAGYFSSPPFSSAPTCFPGFPLLKTCVFDDMTVNNEEFLVKLLSSAPLIESLQFINCLFAECSCIRISSPSLRFLLLDVEALKRNQTIIIGCPNLAQMSVKYDLLKIIEQIPDVKVLKITEVPNPYPSLWKKLITLVNLDFLSLDIVDKITIYDSYHYSVKACDGREDEISEHGKKLEKQVKKLKHKLSNFKAKVYDLESKVERMEKEEVKELHILLEGVSFYEVKELQKLVMTVTNLGAETKWFIRQAIEKCPKLAFLSITVKKDLEEDEKDFVCTIAKLKRASTISIQVNASYEEEGQQHIKMLYKL